MGLLGGAGSTICQLCLSALWRWGLRCCHVSHEHDARGSRAFSNQYEIHGKFHEHERDVKGVDTTAWVALVDMLPAYENVDALSDAIDAFDEAMLEAREGELAVLQAEEAAGGACGD